MAKGGLKVKLDDETYEIDFDKVSLGEARLLKERFDLKDFANFNFFDPDQLVGVLFIAVKHAHPELDDDEILAKVEAIPNGPIFEALDKQVEEARKKAANPRKATAKGTPAVAGSSATTRKSAGSPSTSASSA
jgi:hypothetical protein